MQQISLPFYKQFACLADKCPLNCCQFYRIGFFNWEADQFDTNPLWKDVDGKGGCIRKYLEKDEYGWILAKGEHGGCIFFENNMCSLQKRNGAMAQPSICRTFPRIITRFEDREELALDPCCPAVPYLAKGWKLCDFEITGDGELARDAKYVKREKVLNMLTDNGLSLKKCFEAMASEYDATLSVPEFSMSAIREEFFRKVTALLVWAFIIPYEGYPSIANMMEYCLDLMIQTDALFTKDNVSDDWWEMSVRFTRLFIDSILETDFDRDFEDSYLDVTSK